MSEMLPTNDFSVLPSEDTICIRMVSFEVFPELAVEAHMYRCHVPFCIAN
jgi:hypothetical protein